MNKVTSMSDLLEKVKTDNRYKWLVIYGFFEAGNGYPYQYNVIKVPYQVALNWIFQWIDSNVKGDSPYESNRTCKIMMDHLNKFIVSIENKETYLQPPID